MIDCLRSPSSPIGDAFMKLNPRLMVKNPVMFVTMVGAAISTVDALPLAAARPLVRHANRHVALVHRAVRELRRSLAEGRGKAQAKALRQTRTRTRPIKLPTTARIEVRGRRLAAQRRHRHRRAPAKSFPPTAKSSRARPRWTSPPSPANPRPSSARRGGDRSAVTGGTRVLSDEIKIRITANPGEGFLDRMISLVEGAKRQKTPNEIALTILLAGADDHLSARRS